ncbi:MAG: hypothetical protein K8R54_03205 [Bacteroidales bacterium]|nr:hypothetical protein [Bacteroidales bacterium]
MKKIIPITPITGGVPVNIIGRETEICKYWKILENQGFVLYAQRRFGKSSVLRKMEQNKQENYTVAFISLEGLNNPEEFVNKIYDKLKKEKLVKEKRLKKADNFFNGFVKRFPKVMGVELAQQDKKWKNKLEYLLYMLVEQNPNKLNVIMLDEFTIMLNAMQTSEASEILGFLRNLSQNNKLNNSLRFVYCGSIGINLVIDKLRREGHKFGDPINHLKPINLKPFNDEDAMYFAKCLNAGCKLNLSDENLELICKITDRIPFYIDKLFEKIRYENDINNDFIEKKTDELLNDKREEFRMDYLYKRIQDYYENKELCVIILNSLAKSQKGLYEEELINICTAQEEISEPEIKDTITKLWKDDYFTRERKGDKRFYKFSYSVIKKWWKFNKA